MSMISTAESGSFKERFKRKAKAKLGHRRGIKSEENEVAPVNPAPLPTDVAGVSGANSAPQDRRTIAAEPVEPEGRNFQALISATPAVGEAASAGRRPVTVSRGISLAVRAPPVFRAADNGAQTRARCPANQLGRSNSTPNISTIQCEQEKLSRAPLHTASEFSTTADMSGAPVEEREPPVGIKTSIILLLASTALVAVCAEFMVSSIEHLVENTPLSEAFVGLIILPIVGNAAEHVTAVVVASKNKLDLALGVSLGSSIQIALFITPLVVIIGWITDKGMSLYFTLFETVALFVSVFVVCFLCLDGRSNYLGGALLCGSYVIIGVGAYFFPDSEGQNAFVGGTSDGTGKLL